MRDRGQFRSITISFGRRVAPEDEAGLLYQSLKVIKMMKAWGSTVKGERFHVWWSDKDHGEVWEHGQKQQGVMFNMSRGLDKK